LPCVIVRVPAIVTFPVNVIPDKLLIVRLFRFATLEGTWIPADVPPNTRLDDDVVVRFAGVPAIVGPFSVSVFAPTVKAPEVRVRVPPTVTFPHIETALLIMRLFKVTAGKLAVPEPPIVIFEVAPPVRVPQFICPLSVSVFAPIDNPAPAGLNVPLTVRELCKVTTLVFVIERLFKAITLEGIKTPAEIPPKTRLDDDVVDRFEGVPAIVGPFRVSVYPATAKVPEVRVRVPLRDKSSPKVIFLLTLKLFSPPDIGFRVTAVPVPIVMLEVVPPVNEPLP
jgi:hypothetical protein